MLSVEVIPQLILSYGQTIQYYGNEEKYIRIKYLNLKIGYLYS